MTANGERPPPPQFMIKKEGGFDADDDDDDDDDDDGNGNVNDDDHHVGNISNNMKGISIAERRAAKCGFNYANINNGSSPHGLRSPYVTIPAGISPSALLDSPVLLPNAQAQLSPTTGTFHQLPLSPNPESLKLKLKLATEDEADSTIIPTDSSSNSKPDPNNFTLENLPFKDCFGYPRDFEQTSKDDCLEDTLAKPSNTTNRIMFQEIRSTIDNPNSNIYRENDHHHQRGGAYIPKEVAKHSEDGFYWRKYGQKHVKGSEFPRSYYKCTNANCLVKKKVERSHAGEITQIVYKGCHNHPVPQPAFSNRTLNEMPGQMAGPDNGGCDGTSFKAEGAKDVSFGPNIRNWMPNGCLDGATSTTSILSDFCRDPLSVIEAQEFSSSNNLGGQDGDDQNQASPESISFKDEDDENGECEPKKRKRENLPNDQNVQRSARESKVVVQIESDVDILDDGYRWRKYGQKVVKGNPNPRSYYKCTTPGCPVRKHVERAADDIKSVLTTYEGKHNHDVPTSKTGSLAIPDHTANQPPPAAASTISNPSPTARKHDHVSKAGKRAQDLPLFMETERKPILGYNDFMMSNLAGNFTGTHDHLSFGTSPSLYPYSFPPFPSLAYNSLLMNGNNHAMAYSPSSKFSYPMAYSPSDYLSLPSQISHVPNIGNNITFNNYATTSLQYSSRGHDQIRDCQNASFVKPKEEPTDDEGELYDTNCMSVPRHGNGSL